MPNRRPTIFYLIRELWSRGDKAISPDLLIAHHALQQQRMLLLAQQLKRGHWRQMIGQKLAINRDQIGRLGDGVELVDIRKIARHFSPIVAAGMSQRMEYDAGMPFQITTTRHFSAAHQLRLYDGSLEPLHGHNWKVKVTVSAAKLDEIGVVMDFHELERRVNRIVEPMHNRNLNDLAPFKSINPSAENVAVHIAQKLDLPQGVKLESVEVWETSENSAVFRS